MVRVVVATTGGDPDLDGYRILVDSIEAESVGVSASTTLADLPAGAHFVSLTGIAANCTVAQANPASALVVGGEISRCDSRSPARRPAFTSG